METITDILRLSEIVMQLEPDPLERIAWYEQELRNTGNLACLNVKIRNKDCQILQFNFNSQGSVVGYTIYDKYGCIIGDGTLP